MRKLASLGVMAVAATLALSAPAYAFGRGGFHGGGFHGNFGGFHGGFARGGWHGNGWHGNGWHGRGLGWGLAGLGLGLGVAAATSPYWGYDSYYPYGYDTPYSGYCQPGYNCPGSYYYGGY